MAQHNVIYPITPFTFFLEAKIQLYSFYCYTLYFETVMKEEFVQYYNTPTIHLTISIVAYAFKAPYQ